MATAPARAGEPYPLAPRGLLNAIHAMSAPAQSGAPELTVVVPTFNERQNVPLLVERMAKVLDGIAWEVLFVDDNSPDDTFAAVAALASQDPRVRGIRRVGRRGLSGACIEGMLASQAPFIAVMDADLQHDDTILPAMLAQLRTCQFDLVIGSRYVGEGRADEGLSRSRLASSRMATRAAQAVLGVTVTDPMSGFFMMRRDVIHDVAPELATEGFKILADILATRRGRLRVSETPYGFRNRLHGESKLDSRVALDFAGLLVAKATRNLVPVRFVSFVMVGAIGVLVHLLALRLGLTSGLGFAAAQTVATVVAMTSNFWLNNRITYVDQRLAGARALRGLLLFYAICAVGAVSNISVATLLYEVRPTWWLAGLAGSTIGAVWNYALSSTLVWRR
jgi:dolichol-phosphate mannosyltransferase